MIIPADRKKVPGAMIVGLLLCAFSIYRVIVDRNETSVYGPTAVLSYVVLFLFAAFFSLRLLADYLKTCFDSRATLVINDIGIVDNLSIFSCGELEWSEMAAIRLDRRIDDELLVILVRNPGALIDKQKRWKRVVLKSFLKKYGSPVIITQKKVSPRLSDLSDLLLSQIGKH
jgi:hypothetical protein